MSIGGESDIDISQEYYTMYVCVDIRDRNGAGIRGEESGRRLIMAGRGGER